jgi:hypothetical protein
MDTNKERHRHDYLDGIRNERGGADEGSWIAKD